MRDAIAQRANTMILIGACAATVRAACQTCGERGFIKPLIRKRDDETSAAQEGQRCALLTTKSRNTCTRATVFNSSG